MQPRRGKKSIKRAVTAARSSGEPAPAGVAPDTGTRFQSSFDQVAVGIAHTTTDGRILEANRRLCELLGYTAAELLSMTTRELTHPDDRDQQDNMRQQLLDGSCSHFSGDKRYLHKNGSVIWVSRTVALARNSPDDEPYLIQTIDSIAERKGAETELKNSLSLLQATLESTTDGILVVNGTGQIMSYNRRFLELWRVPESLMETCDGNGLIKFASEQLIEPRSFSAKLHELCSSPAESSEDIIVFKDGRIYERNSRPQTVDGANVGRVWSFHDVTARKELARSFELTFSHAAVGMVLTSLDGHYLMVNRAFANMLGYTPEEMTGMKIIDTVYPGEEHEQIEQARHKILRGEITQFSRERRFFRKDKSVVWTNHTISPARDESGRPLYFIRVIEDITERKALERRYQETFDQAAVGIVHTSHDGKYLRMNRRFCEMLGYDKAELLGHAAAEFTHPDDRNQVAHYRQDLWEGKISKYAEEKRYIRKDGSILWAFRTVSLARDASGKPLHFIRIVEDISERKQAAEIIARERALLRTIIDALPDHVYAKDRNGNFMLANKTWLAARDEQSENIVGKTTHDYFSPDVAERMNLQDRGIIETGTPVANFEQRMIIKGHGQHKHMVRWASTTKVPLKISTGEIIGTVGISHDITEEKRVTARRALSHTVTYVLAESKNLQEAMPKIIQAICETMEWSYGARWAVDGKTEQLCRMDYWCENEPDFDPADRDLWSRLDDPGKGRFLRHAWIDKEPVWITNLQDDKPFRRKASVLKLGWHSAYAIPILIENNAIGVLEFFGPQLNEPDEAMIQSTSAISSQIGQFIQRKEAEDKVAFLAQFDAITDLPNRFLFSDRLEQLLTQAHRNDWSVGVLFVDLDRFKVVNDTYGHAAGDQLLRMVASRMQQCVRVGDTVGRLSGDEFAVILSNLAKADDAGMVAQKIVDALAAPFDIDGHQAYISASVGIAIYPGDGKSPDDLLKNADTAMYLAKERGRNGYQFYLPEMNERLILRQKIDAQLHDALEREEFLLYYQPKVSLTTGAITGFETLLRWQRDGELVSPAEFISILEETSLIVPVGEWILRSVCTQLKQWEQAGITPRAIAVNLSARQFQRKNLAEVIGQILSESGVNPALLKLELTESLLMSDAKESVETLHQLKHLGVQLSVDDFGTGYSSLAYLKRFPLDELKIDREFIRDAISDPDDAAIALSIINLAHTLKLRVVAEGVETEGQLNFLWLHGCDEMQGYYFSRPLPVAECTRMLIEDKRLPQISHKRTSNVTSLLLVVDHPDELQRLSQAFTTESFVVLTANNALEGFEILAQRRVDVVISDNDMPGMNGIEFLTRVRKLYTHSIRVLASSGDETPTLTRATNRAGIHLFLPKHWAAERLRTEVREILQTYANATDTTSSHPVLRVQPE